MKVTNFGLDLKPGKYQYTPGIFNKLVEKFEPKKITPYTMEFLDGELEKSDAVIFDNKKKIDLLLIDLEKIEKRLTKTEDEKERKLLETIQNLLEKETLLCDIRFDEQESGILKHLQFVTFKPAVGKDKADDVPQLIEEVMKKAGIFLFYTAGKKEVHAWELKQGSTAIDAAGKIHSDLARGFIKAEIVSGRELDNFFNMAEAKTKGLVKQVDRDYPIQEGDIIEIKFNV